MFVDLSSLSWLRPYFLLKAQGVERADPLFKCASCNYVHYYSKECQKTSWKTDGRKQLCKEIHDARYGEFREIPTFVTSRAKTLK